MTKSQRMRLTMRKRSRIRPILKRRTTKRTKRSLCSRSKRSKSLPKRTQTKSQGSSLKTTSLNLRIAKMPLLKQLNSLRRFRTNLSRKRLRRNKLTATLLSRRTVKPKSRCSAVIPRPIHRNQLTRSSPHPRSTRLKSRRTNTLSMPKRLRRIWISAFSARPRSTPKRRQWSNRSTPSRRSSRTTRR